MVLPLYIVSICLLLQESHHSIVQFELASGSFSLSQLFCKMEEAQRDLPVEDYSISQNTLDNVSSHVLSLDTDTSQGTGRIPGETLVLC